MTNKTGYIVRNWNDKFMIKLFWCNNWKERLQRLKDIEFAIPGLKLTFSRKNKMWVCPSTDQSLEYLKSWSDNYNVGFPEKYWVKQERPIVRSFKQKKTEENINRENLITDYLARGNQITKLPYYSSAEECTVKVKNKRRKGRMG